MYAVGCHTMVHTHARHTTVRVAVRAHGMVCAHVVAWCVHAARSNACVDKGGAVLEIEIHKRKRRACKKL